MSANNELLDKLKEFLSEDEIKQGIEKGVIKVDVEKGIMPLTGHQAGLESGTGAVISSTPPPASWEMVKTSVQKALDEVEKATAQMGDYMSKADYKEEEDEDVEKAYDKMMTTTDRMKQHAKMYKAKMKTNKSLGFNEDDFEKAFQDKFQDINKQNQELSQKNETLEKSISNLTELITKMQEDVQKIGEQRPVPKSVNLQAFIEKGGVKDDGGKRIYHIEYHKDQIVNELEKAKHDADDIMKGNIDDDILSLVSANGAPTAKVAQFLYDKCNVKIIK